MPPINESGLLLSSVHVALLGACALMAAHGFLRQWPDVLHACSIGVISSIVFATQTIIFIPKVKYLPTSYGIGNTCLLKIHVQ